MSSLTVGATIWRNFETDGVPSSGAHKVIKADMRAWMTAMEAFAPSVVKQYTDFLAIGYNAGTANLTPNPPHYADGNTFIGYNCGSANTSGFAQTFLGSGSGNATTTGDSNVYVGYQAGALGTTAKWNVAVGVDALQANILGWNNTVVGHHAGISVVFADTAGENVIIGAEAVHVGVGGIQNTITGYRAGYYVNASGTENSIYGHLAAFALTSGAQNAIFGKEAATTATSSSALAVVGYRAGYNLTTGNTSVMIGYLSGFTATTSTGNVFLGPNAGFYETASSRLFIDNATRSNLSDARVKALVYGIFDAAVANQYLTINGQLQVAGVGTHYFMGNTAIGATSAASYWLRVVGGNANSVAIDNDGSEYTELDYLNNGTVRATTFFDSAGGASSFNFRTLSTHAIIFGTNSAQRLQVTGLGSIVPGTAALSTSATDGFIYAQSFAGTPTGVPTAFTGRVAFGYDSTNNKWYVYNGAWKAVTLS